MKDAISPLAGEIVELGELASLAELERDSPPTLQRRHSVAVERTELYPSPPSLSHKGRGRRVPARSPCESERLAAVEGREMEFTPLDEMRVRGEVEFGVILRTYLYGEEDW